MQRDTPRRLAAILAADIAGYSRLMGSDETGTHIRVRQVLHDCVEPTIAEHRGRLVKTTGDGFIAMFDSPVEAVRCAIVIQQSMVRRNLELPRPQWLQFRIGVNLGDVIIDNGDVFGDGVNIASRLEQMAEVGGVYISGGIYEQVKYKLVCGYQSLGDRKVKHITDPVPIYRVLPDPAAVERVWKRKTWLNRALFLAVMLVSAGGGAWYFWRPQAREVPANRTSSAPAQPTPGPTPIPAPGPATGRTPSEPRIPEEPSPIQGLAGPVQTAAIQPAPANKAVPAPEGSGQTPGERTAILLNPANPEPARLKEPEMILLRGGTFEMGSNEDPTEKPVHAVNVRPFWIARYPVTVKEWLDCVAANACTYVPREGADRPVTNVSWNDTKEFLSWLSHVTGKEYRLPTEAEWEFAARGGTQTRYWWGNQVDAGKANCKGCGGAYDPTEPMGVGSFSPNPFGIYDMAGGVAEWVSDCWHKDYHTAPSDGSSWDRPNCTDRVLRGGSWKDGPATLRVSDREYYEADVRYPTHGFRVAHSE